MPEVEYEDRSDEPEWRLPSRTEPGIVGRKVDDSEYRRPQGNDWIPATPPDLPQVPLLGFGLGVITAGVVVMAISGSGAWSWIVVIGIALLAAGLVRHRR